MKIAETNINLIDSYYALLKSLSPDNKLELIVRLSQSMTTMKKSKDDSWKSLFGALVLDQSADEFVEGLKNIEEGSALVLENIFFEFDKTELLPESYVELNKIADFMLENNINRIDISGHTDSEGSDAYNQKLSEGRAQAVVDYLISRGVHPVSMEAVGYGKSSPIDTNLTEEGRAINRRVEFMLVKR